MKICVLDDVTMTQNQVEYLHSLGDVKIFSGLPSSLDEILSRANDCDILILGWTNISAEIIAGLPSLKMIAVWATGVDYIDLTATSTHNIVVSNVPGYGSSAVAELTIALILSLYRNLLGADRHVRNGEYNWKAFQGRQLEGKTLGIVGTGAIGAKVAALAKGFGMEVLGFTAHPSDERARQLGLKYVDLPVLLGQSDVVSLHVSLSEATQHLIGPREFDLMKPSALLINTARADIVDQAALLKKLEHQETMGAGLDDINRALPSADALLKLNNVVLTPHMGFNTAEAIVRKTDICLNNVASFIAGQPTNVVNKF